MKGCVTDCYLLFYIICPESIDPPSLSNICLFQLGGFTAVGVNIYIYIPSF